MKPELKTDQPTAYPAKDSGPSRHVPAAQASISAGLSGRTPYLAPMVATGHIHFNRASVHGLVYRQYRIEMMRYINGVWLE